MTYDEQKVNSSKIKENNNEGDYIDNQSITQIEEISDDICPPVILFMNFPQIKYPERSLQSDQLSTDTRSTSLESESIDVNLSSKNTFSEK